jgi:hypothetical protein
LGSDFSPCRQRTIWGLSIATSASSDKSGGGKHEPKNNPEHALRSAGRKASLKRLVYRTRSRGAPGVSGAPLRPRYSHHGLVLPGGLGNPGRPTEPRFHGLLQSTILIKFDGTIVMMLLSFRAKKKCKIREVYYGGHFGQQFSAVRNCVHPVQ